MDLQPKIEPASSTSHDIFNEMSVSELVSDLRTNCDKVEEVFFTRDAKHKAEIDSLAVKYELERLQRLHIEDELKKKEEQHLYLERKWLDDIAGLRFRCSELEEQNKKNTETIQKLKDENTRLEKEKSNADAEKHLNEMAAVPDSSLSKKRKKGVGHCIGKSSDINRLNEWHIAGALDFEVLRNSTNASEELQHEQVSEPLKSVVEEEPDHSNICEDEIPKEGMCFESCAEAHGFYKNYASKVGFLVKIKTTNYLQNDNEEKIIANQSILCNKHGNRTSRVKAPIRYKKIASAMCNARVYVKLDKVIGKWFYAIFESKHTHPCSPQRLVHYHECRVLSLHAKCVIEDNDEADIRPNNTYLALSNEVGAFSNLNFSEKDVRNYISSKFRTSDVNLEVKKMLMYFNRMKEINLNFFYEVEVDDNYRLKSVFWADARSIASYEYFGDVVSFDTTYKKNKHGLPFVSFIGVNHHGKSIPLGCALLGNEKIPSFEWLLTNWLRCMGNPPSGIITDQCKLIQAAIKKVLPNTRHRWCIWHIMKNLPQKLMGYSFFKSFSDQLTCIVWNTRSTISFESEWLELIARYKLEQNNWLSGLFENRHMWVPVYFQNEFWAGMRSTQRSESMYAFYGGFLHTKTSLIQFVHEFDNVLRNKEQKELEDDVADSKGVLQCVSSSLIELQFQQEYTNQMFRDVQVQFLKKGDCIVKVLSKEGDMYSLKVDEQKLISDKPVVDTYSVSFDLVVRKCYCECNLFQSKAILCCHMLSTFAYFEVNEVPTCYISSRWSKNVRRKHSYIKSSHDVNRSDESNNLFGGCVVKTL